MKIKTWLLKSWIEEDTDFIYDLSQDISEISVGRSATLFRELKKTVLPLPKMDRFKCEFSLKIFITKLSEVKISISYNVVLKACDKEVEMGSYKVTHLLPDAKKKGK